MFGIGLPELILIMAVALIVVGPEKLPELAKTLARQMVELKKAANTLKDSLNDEETNDKPWEKITPEQPQIADLSPVRPLDILPDIENKYAPEQASEDATDHQDETTAPTENNESVNESISPPQPSSTENTNKK